MDLRGIKIRTIKPGIVAPNHENRFIYSIEINGISFVDRPSFPSANAAKQAMREEVYRLRRVHGLI